jgi:hypothetical protein
MENIDRKINIALIVVLALNIAVTLIDWSK